MTSITSTAQWSTRINQVIFAVLDVSWTMGLNSDKTSKVFCINYSIDQHNYFTFYSFTEIISISVLFCIDIHFSFSFRVKAKMLNIHTQSLWVKKNWTFSFYHNFGKYSPILIILSLLQTEINCDQAHPKIYHQTPKSASALPCKMKNVLANVAGMIS